MTTETKTLAGHPFDRGLFESLVKRRLFFTEAFEIYRTSGALGGDGRGLFDYGPPGCALQSNIVDAWRRHFVLEENMLELDCTIMTPEAVFKTSGHVDKFEDWMCKDSKSGDFLRADHLIENVLEARLKGDRIARGLGISSDDSSKPVDAKKQKRKVKDIQAVKLPDQEVAEYEEILAKIDNYNGTELGELISRLDIRNPDGNNPVSPPTPFNLMFKTTLGPSSASPAYLRPETAQGQFLNFKKLSDYNQNLMPFASASIGKSFRNEISPRSGLLRVREFLMAEIEHFVDPEGGKKHPRFHEVQHISLSLLNRSVQLSGSSDLQAMTIGDAVAEGIIDNETLGYFLARIYLFLLRIGVDKTKLRFRQHMANEMAHYAADCWDAELLTSYGWIECVGCADRSAYDLTVHSRRTGEPLVVREPRAEPLRVEEWQMDINRAKFGPTFRKDAKAVEAALNSLSQSERENLSGSLDQQGFITLQVPGMVDGSVKVPRDLITLEKRTRVENTREYTPNVIEPSFGIGRILYSLLEHVYWHRPDDVARGVLSLPLSVAATKLLIVPLSNQPRFIPVIQTVSQRLRELGISCRVDNSSASIGKRYSRNDELGIPLGITIDFDTLKDDTITLRERDSTKQVRASQSDIVDAIKSLVDGKESWGNVFNRLPEFVGQSGDL
ncbi:glycyl-tRNA synthetase [Aspergillus steynii IBT 23096]|uniref:glycine--tRNA ligase n=1 Tax=Aspergillus steynii IBT 23096 TaxID=1392250 RepID=A0A2I2G4F1_9EURO|nr:glycyl-tRNA synthetase [Aspergillus steynii IBT 23096]PLB47756.1 glycyl-tRNA synthetase [Aspergillus steynii IBT 23096]